MWIGLAIASAVIFGIGSVVMKSATLRHCLDQHILFGLYLSGALIFLVTSGSSFYFHYDSKFVLFAFLVAIGSFSGNWAVIKALELGPASLTAPMLNMNLPLIILMSVVFYGESLDAIKILVILCLLAGVVLVKVDPNERLVIKSRKWFLYVFLGAICLFLREGGLKITQEAGIHNPELLFVSYVMCIAFTCVTIFFISKKKKSNLPRERENGNHRRKSVYYGVGAGLCSGVGLLCYSSALTLGPTSLVALIFSARSVVIVFFSYFIHKERLSILQVGALVLLTVGLALASFSL